MSKYVVVVITFVIMLMLSCNCKCRTFDQDGYDSCVSNCKEDITKMENKGDSIKAALFTECSNNCERKNMPR